MSGHVHHLFEIKTDIFLGVGPRPDAINKGIGGDELAAWLFARLSEGGYACRDLGAEDHSWDFDVAHEGLRYRVVCSCEFEAEDEPARAHVAQVAQTRGATVDPDPLLGAVRALLAGNPDFVVATDEARRRR